MANTKRGRQRGITGPPGPPGAQGATGKRGAKGATGERGARGEGGPQAPPEVQTDPLPPYRRADFFVKCANGSLRLQATNGRSRQSNEMSVLIASPSRQ